MTKVNTKVSINTNESVKAQIDTLKGELTYTQILEYMLMVSNMKNEPIGLTKVELLVIKLLTHGHPRKITQSDLRKMTGCNNITCSEICKLYAVEIEAFNKKYA